MENNYPQKSIEQYLKASSKLKKFDRVVVFKRFGPNVNEVANEFGRLASVFEDAGIYQYAAMCHLGVAKCEAANANAVNECHALLRAARSFLKAHQTSESLQLRSHRREYRDGALLCYTHAIEKSPDDAVMKAAIIREMTQLHGYEGGTSSFASPSHRIYELEMAAQKCVQQLDFLPALQHLDDIVDNIYERKQEHLYVDLLRDTEISRALLLVASNMPACRQSPAHIKLIEYYYEMANFEGPTESLKEGVASGRPGPRAFVPMQMKCVLAEMVSAWLDRRWLEVKAAVVDMQQEFLSLTEEHRCILNSIYMDVESKV